MIAPTYESRSSASGAGTQANFTSPAVTNANYAIITIHWQRNTAPASGYHCTFDGVECTLITSRAYTSGSNYWGVLMYKHPNPGSSKAVHLSWTQSGGYWVACCSTYKDVGLNDPHGSPNTSAGKSTSPGLSVSSAVGERVIDAGSQNVTSAVAGGGQTRRLHHHDSNTLGFTSDEPGAAGNTSMNWTTNYSRDWVLVGVSLRGYPAPAVTECDPDNGPIAGGTSVTLTGTGFLDGATVTFDGDAADNIVVVSLTEITCDTPAHDEGLVDIVVTNDDTQNGTLEDGFEYLAGGNGGKSHSKRQFLGLI